MQKEEVGRRALKTNLKLWPRDQHFLEMKGCLLLYSPCASQAEGNAGHVQNATLTILTSPSLLSVHSGPVSLSEPTTLWAVRDRVCCAWSQEIRHLR